MEDRRAWLAAQLHDGVVSADERRDFASLDETLRRIPFRQELRQPTRLGNILLAAETMPEAKYGLDVATCWPRLWLVLTEPAKQELDEARGNLNIAIEVWTWGAFFLIWSVWAWWAVPVGLAVSFASYHSALSRAGMYGGLVESVFDLYRPDLYRSLRFPLPKSPAEEVKLGRTVSRYLYQGSDDPYPPLEPLQ